MKALKLRNIDFGPDCMGGETLRFRIIERDGVPIVMN